MARYQYDASPLSNDLATAINEHSAALDKLIAAGSAVPSVAYADGTLTGVDPVEMTIVIPDHATQDLDFVLPFKGELIDAYVKKIIAAGGSFANTIQVKTALGAAVITDAMSLNGVAQGGIVRAANISDTAGAAVVNATGAFRVTQTKAGGDASARLHLRWLVRA